MKPVEFFDSYRKNGFFFSEEILTRYAISLYTKPFTILSGISGTGKTKIAQLFNLTPVREETPAIPESEDYITITLRDGVMTGDGRGNFNFKDLPVLFEESELENIHEQIEQFRREDNGGNIIEKELFQLDLNDNETIQFHLYLQRASSPLVRARFKSARNSTNKFDYRELLSQLYNIGDVLKLEKVGRRHLRVASVNDLNAVSAEEIRRTNELNTVSNKLFVAVKSNWTDSSNLLGYYNPIDERYSMTPVLEFLMKAQEYSEIPFYLVLDEMNLSKVEYYFSDFLSALESRYYDSNGQIEQEGMNVHSSSELVETDNIVYDLLPGNIKIPLNLYVTGTINIDESTYMFSPKVLDRANVIEFNEVDLEKYSSSNAISESSKFSLTSLPKFGNYQIPSRDDYLKTDESVRDTLKDLSGILKKYNAHFGYRTANEIALFVNNCHQLIEESKSITTAALDFQVTQKILPKLNGSFSKLDAPIRDLLSFFLEESIGTNDLSLEDLSEFELKEKTKYPHTTRKLLRMHQKLVSNGFANFLD